MRDKQAEIERRVENEPYGGSEAELWGDAVDLECTGMDDHDDSACEKCSRLRRRIVKAIQCALDEKEGYHQKFMENHQERWNCMPKDSAERSQ